uniref:Peptide deformylase n=1 Tax=Glossina austeni TaxID=7395 RepID=A0A1A9VTU1_GLOAU
MKLLEHFSHFTTRTKVTNVPEEAIKEPEIADFVDQMIKMLRKYNCVGIAAPQIGISLRIIVMECKENLKEKFSKEVYLAREMSTLPLTVMINPTLKVLDYDKRWNARLAQHEMDHLDGKLYIDHMDPSTFHCTCWEVVNRKAGRVEIPFYK